MVRSADGRRVVSGEVMLPSPPLENGQRIARSALQGLVHFDGAFMTEPEVQLLADRFAQRRPAVDVQHDGIPRAATVVESFIVRGAWDPWTTPGAWVTGVQIHEQPAWDAIERGDLSAFSVQFLVTVKRVVVVVINDDGSEQQVLLHEFLNAQPQFLSLVDNPATGAHWKIKDRAALPARGLPVVDREWDAAAAYQRVQRWAEGDQTRMVQAFATWGEGGGTQIADVVDGQLMVVRSALAQAAPQDLPQQEVARFNAALYAYDDSATRLPVRRVANKAVIPFQDLPLAPPDTPWNATAARSRLRAHAGGEDWDTAVFRRGFVWFDSERSTQPGAYQFPIADVIGGEIQAVPRALAAAAARVTTADIAPDAQARVRSHLALYYRKMDRSPPWDVQEDRMVMRKRDDSPNITFHEGKFHLVDADGTIGAEVQVGADGQLAEIASATDEGADAVAAAAGATDDGSTTAADTAGAVNTDAGSVNTDASTVDATAGAVNTEADPVNTGAAADQAAADAAAAAGADTTGALGDASTTAPDAASTDTVDADAADAAAAADGAADAANAADAAGVDVQDVARGIFGEMLGARAVSDSMWDGAIALHDTFLAIIETEEITDKVGQMKAAVNDFGQWAFAAIDNFAAMGMTTDASFMRSVQRSEGGLSADQLTQLQGLHATLGTMLGQLTVGDGTSNADAADAAGTDGTTDTQALSEGDTAAAATEVSRSVANVTEIHGDRRQQLQAQYEALPDALRQAVDGVFAENASLRGEVAEVRRARPAGTVVDDDDPSEALSREQIVAKQILKL